MHLVTSYLDVQVQVGITKHIGGFEATDTSRLRRQGETARTCRGFSDPRVRIFLMADAVTCALPAQSTPQGYYSIERMLKAVINKGGQVKACGTCSEARGIKGLALLEGVEISTMSQLAQWAVEADKVLTF